MTHSISRSLSLALLCGLATATCAIAQNTDAQGSAQGSTEGASTQGAVETKSNNDSDQGTNQSNQQNQNQDSSNANNSNTQQQNTEQQGTAQKQQSDQDASAPNNSQPQANQNNQTQQNQDSKNRSSSTQPDNQRSSANSRTNQRTDDRNVQNDQQDVNNRSSQSVLKSSRDQEFSRGNNMRGPDIGLWFGRSNNGLVISDVSTNGPIAKFGFREGDRIISVNGHKVIREDEFMQYVLRSNADRVTVIVLRGGQQQTIVIEPAVFVADNSYVEVDPLEQFGIIVDDRYDDRIVVWRVVPRSSAYYAGFRPGDVITTFGGRPYKTRTEFQTSARDWKPGDVDVQVRRGERTRGLSVTVPPLVGARAALRNDRRVEQQPTNRDGNDQGTQRGPGILNRNR